MSDWLIELIKAYGIIIFWVIAAIFIIFVLPKLIGHRTDNQNNDYSPREPTLFGQGVTVYLQQQRFRLIVMHFAYHIVKPHDREMNEQIFDEMNRCSFLPPYSIHTPELFEGHVDQTIIPGTNAFWKAELSPNGTMIIYRYEGSNNGVLPEDRYEVPILDIIKEFPNDRVT